MSYMNYLDDVFSILSNKISKLVTIYVLLNVENNPTLTEMQFKHDNKLCTINIQTPVSDIMIGDFNIAAQKTCLELIALFKNKQKGVKNA